MSLLKRRRRIPTVFRRTPFHKRLPDWAQEQIKKTGNAGRQLVSVLRKVNLRGPGWTWIIVASLSGVCAGVVVMKQRHASQEVLAVVRGTKITAPDFHRRLEIEAGPQVLRKMVAEELTLQFARQQGVYPTDPAVAARIKQAQQRGELSPQMLRNHATSDDLARMFRVQMAEAALFEDNVTVTDQDARSYYRHESDPANPTARFYTPETALIELIITSTEGTGRKALAALGAGKPFAQVARQFSQDLSARSGGAVAPVHRGRFRGRAVPGLEDAIFSLNSGDQFGPRLFGGGWWIVRCREKTPAAVQPFEKVSAECREGAKMLRGLTSNKARVVSEYDKFRLAVPIQVFWDQYVYDLQQAGERVATSK